ncbi:MAG TPA: fibronectin type III domain-containing protein, partial [Candidatus Limnocylindrales bacterium]|nr:fibronectin type III domain-containing protein [Candidatus Limnocylindrales bacterium]
FVSASATANAAMVNWVPTPNGQALSTYVVRTLLAGGSPSGIADVTVNPGANGTLPTSVSITGLANGVAVEFVVQACNASGCSAFSAPSGVVTPQQLTIPAAPSGVVATAGNKAATIAWTAPANTGGSPLISYTITANPGALVLTVPATQTGANFTGLTNGSTYTFTVHATNASGNSVESPASNAVTLLVVQAVDIGISMTAPASANAGAFVTFTMTLANNGPGDAAMVTLTDTLPGTFVSSSTTQGVCAQNVATFTCNLGGLLAGAKAVVKVTVAAGNQAITNTASVQLRDAFGNLINETVGANNVASATININPPVGGGGGGGVGVGGAGASADVQVTGSARNGGPNAGTGDTFVWQIKNNTGNATAQNVVFTLQLPSNFQFLDAAASQGTCSGISQGSTGGTLTCNLANLPGGQTMLVNVDFVPLIAGTFSATGSATFGGTDTQTTNNSFSVTIRPR